VDHETAVQSLAAERYILGELSRMERDEFEEHLSECPKCMEHVSTGDIFIANTRAVFADQAAGDVPQVKNAVVESMRKQ
jgi:anti-sigma factor RsiW